MSLTHLVFLTLAVSHMLLVALYFLVHHWKQPFARLISLFFLCVIAYLMASIPGDVERHGPVVEIILHRFGNLTVLLLWLISHHLFADDQRTHPLVWWLGGIYMILRAVGSTFSNLDLSYSSLFFIVTYALPQLIMVGFVFHAFYLTIRGYEIDLVSERRIDRVAFVIGMGVLLTMIAINASYRILNSLLAISNDTLLLIPTQYYSIYLYLVTVAFFLWRFRLARGSLLSLSGMSSINGNSSAEHNKLGKEDLRLIERVRKAMVDDKLFLKHKLTVGELAKHIDSQEYRIRRVINQQLNFRNFSDFLNQYRIAETARRLTETEESISYIGLDVGYTSLSSFHKAFKKQHQLTPKEYRMRHQVDI